MTELTVTELIDLLLPIKEADPKMGVVVYDPYSPKLQRECEGVVIYNNGKKRVAEIM